MHAASLRANKPRLLAALGLAAALSAAAISAPVALAQCDPHAVNSARVDDNTYYWVGFQQYNVTGLTGVKSTILNYKPYVPAGHMSYSWVMLSNNASYHWAQIGPHQVSGGRNLYIQTADGSSSIWDMNLAADALGTSTTVEVFWVNGTFEFWKNGQYEVGPNLSWVPSNASFASEIPSLNTQLMGAQNNHVIFNTNKLYYSGAWHNASGTPVVTYAPPSGAPSHTRHSSKQ